MEELLGRYLGCMLGGAVGDALGYPVEFLKWEEIAELYGEQGITQYKLYDDIALISDDTQMALFTACGLLRGNTRFQTKGIMGDWAGYVYLAYEDWMMTQFERYGCLIPGGRCWLLHVPELYSCRAPGNTCLNALETHKCGKTYSPLNDSKGCGGVMRVAPVGLYLSKHITNIEVLDRMGAEVAAITHGNPLGYIPAAALTHIIARLVRKRDTLEHSMEDAIGTVASLYADVSGTKEFVEKMQLAVELSRGDCPDREGIAMLGEGFVAEEALAMAVYCCLRHPDDFAGAVQAAVNHDGDSDSVGAITGNIMGTYLGVEAIPKYYLEQLELRDVIEELARDLYMDCPLSADEQLQNENSRIWREKYIFGQYIRT